MFFLQYQNQRQSILTRGSQLSHTWKPVFRLFLAVNEWFHSFLKSHLDYKTGRWTIFHKRSHNRYSSDCKDFVLDVKALELHEKT